MDYTSSCKDWALAYAALGLPVFPCIENSKSPMLSNGHNGATLDSEQIEQWWTNRPFANIGIAIPEDMIVVDIDAFNTQQAINLQYIPTTPYAITPRDDGGRHYWFKLPAGVSARPQTEVLPGVDTRAFGGYAIAPPSVHPNGKKYKWGLSILETPMAEIPDWLLELISNPEGHQAAKPGTKVDPASILAGVSEGGRQTALFRLACRLRRLNVSEAEAVAVLEQAAAAASPPYTERKMSDLIRRVWHRYQPGTQQKSERKGWKLSELLSAKFEPSRIYVDRLLPEGLCLFYADPKLGKSMLLSNMMISLARGEYVFNKYKANQCSVLYVDFEQSAERGEYRWRRVLGNRIAPDNLHVYFEWERMDNGGMDELRRFLDMHPDVGVVVLDVLNSFWPIGEPPGQTAYQKDYYVMSKLAQLAKDYKIAIVCVHHRAKAEGRDYLASASGSMGMTAAADAVWMLSRERDHDSAVLKCTGKNIPDSTVFLTIKDEGFIWECNGANPNQTDLIADIEEAPSFNGGGIGPAFRDSDQQESPASDTWYS